MIADVLQMFFFMEMNLFFLEQQCERRDVSASEALPFMTADLGRSACSDAFERGSELNRCMSAR